jgi:oxygen-independent coproporphyrinogen III oxidase
VLSDEALAKLLKALNKNKKSNCEFTVEVNPESFSRSKAKICHDLGVNRLSVGLQSFSDVSLGKLGRIHTASQAREAVIIAKEAGFKNISIDLIFGICGQSLKDWKEELKNSAALGVTHISAYALTYEPCTLLFKKIKTEKLTPVSEELEADMYKYAMSYLTRKGFSQYEVSNFAKYGRQCRHNCNYWDNGSTLAIGASAVSYTKGIRERMIADVEKYIKAVRGGFSPVAEYEKLPLLARAHETAAFKVRTVAGIKFSWFKKHTGFDFIEILGEDVKPLIKSGYLCYLHENDTRCGIALTRKGFLFCDEVSTAFVR